MAVTESEFIRAGAVDKWGEWVAKNGKPTSREYSAFHAGWEGRYRTIEAEHDATEDPNWLMLKDVTERILAWGNSRVNTFYNGHVAYLNQQRQLSLMEAALEDAGIEKLDVPLYRRISNQRKVIKQLTAERDMWKKGLMEKWKEEKQA